VHLQLAKLYIVLKLPLASVPRFTVAVHAGVPHLGHALPLGRGVGAGVVVGRCVAAVAGGFGLVVTDADPLPLAFASELRTAVMHASGTVSQRYEPFTSNRPCSLSLTQI